jgi:putative membrane protein
MSCPVEVVTTVFDQEFLGPEDLPTEIEEMDTEWNGLHPLSLFINLLPQMWQTIRTTWPILLFIFVGGEGSGTQFIDIAFVMIFLFISMMRTLLHFLTLRYRLHLGKLEVKVGLVFRHARTLDPARIQNIELAQNPFHKLTGLVELRVETAGDASTQGLLSALQVDEAQRLKALLQQSKKQTKELEEEVGEEAPPLLEHTISEIVLYGLSQRTVGTVMVLTLIVTELIGIVNPSEAQQIAASITPQSLVALLLLAFSGSWLWSGSKALIQHAKLQLSLTKGHIKIAYGLLTRRQVEIPQQKVQIVEIYEPWLRRRMGYATAYIETAAMGMADGELRKSEGLIPMLERQLIPTFIGWVTPYVNTQIWQQKLQPAHPKALYRIAASNLIQTSCLAVFGVLLFETYGWILLLGIPLSLLVSWLDWTKQGWLITNDAIISRRGYITRRTWLLDTSKVQSVFIYQDPIMRIHNLAQVIIQAAGSRVSLPMINLEDAKERAQHIRGLWPAQQEVDRQNTRQNTNKISSNSSPQSMPVSVDTNTPEVNSENIERGFRGAIHSAGEVSDVTVRSVVLDEFSRDSESPRSAEWPEQSQWEDLTGETDQISDRTNSDDERF